MRTTEAGRGRKGTSDGRTPGDDRDLGAGRGWRRGDNQTREGSHRLAQGTPCGILVREGMADEQWKPKGGGVVQVGGHSTPG